MITNVGLTYFAARNEAAQPLFTAQLYLALSTDATAPAATDTVVPGEITAGGLGRAAATVAHTAGTTTWTFSATFTYTGSATVTVNKLALLDSASGGNLIAEAVIPAATFAVAGDNAPFQFQFTL